MELISNPTESDYLSCRQNGLRVGKLVHATIFCPPLYKIRGWYKQPYEAEILSVLLQVQAVKLCGFKTNVLFPRTLIKRNIQFSGCWLNSNLNPDYIFHCRTCKKGLKIRNLCERKKQHYQFQRACFQGPSLWTTSVPDFHAHSISQTEICLTALKINPHHSILCPK